MKFGRVEDPSVIDFTIPKSHPDTVRILSSEVAHSINIYVGCAKWNKTDLKGFYPKGTKDELSYYATQFNAIELNATFYNLPSERQIDIWRDKTPAGFKFFPKITNTISHYRRLVNVDDIVTQYANNILRFKEKLGTVFLQLHDAFSPREFGKLNTFIEKWPQEIPLAVEVRNSEWFSDAQTFDEFSQMLEKYRITNILVDTAGRRDMLHMRLTTPTAFIRYVGANALSDYTRLDAWVQQVVEWRHQGLQNLYFFVHQNVEEASPLLSAYFIEHLNQALGTQLHIPIMAPHLPRLF